jgi:DNA-damage-inducible protein D
MAKNNDVQQPIEGESKIDLFQNKEVRKVLHDGEWWFVLNDVVETLTDSADPTQYLRKLRTRDADLAALFNPVEKGGVQIVPPLMLPLETPGGLQNSLCWNTEGIFRLVQSIPSKKAEPFKRWLAKVGFERLQEIENPELAIKRAIAIYKSKGYPDDWIDNRIKNKAGREALTNEWQENGVTEKKHMAILTDAVAIESLGISIKEHRELKGLVGNSQNLRDHMTPIELTLTTLGEQATTEIVRAKKPRGLAAHRDIAIEGGGIAGDARRKIENATGRPVVSAHNFLTERQKLNNAKKLAERVAKDDKKPALPAEKPLKIAGGMDKALQQIAKAPKPDKEAA